MNHAVKSEHQPTADSGEPSPLVHSDTLRDRVAAYWRELGLRDPELLAQLTDDCLARARHRVGRGAEEELLRRALEEAQRRFDHALGRAAHLPPEQGGHGLAAVRAAFLLCRDRFSADALFRPGETAPEFAAALQAILPGSTPPESHLTMAETPLRFWLFKSTHR